MIDKRQACCNASIKHNKRALLPMRLKTLFRWFLGFLWVFICQSPLSIAAATTLPLTIAVVRDGPSSYLDNRIQAVIQELKALGGGKYGAGRKAVP